MTIDDDNDDEDDGNADVPAFSRIRRVWTRQYRVLSRTSTGYWSSDRFHRQRRLLPIGELLGGLLEHHGVAEEVRRQAVCLYWPEVVGQRFASKTSPQAFSGGLLRVAVVSSAWVHEMQFHKGELIAKINGWIDDNRRWLGPPPLVTDIRFALAMQRRDRMVDPGQARELVRDHQVRLQQPSVVQPPIASEADRDAILTETSMIVDPELRAYVAAVRTKWNR